MPVAARIAPPRESHERSDCPADSKYTANNNRAWTTCKLKALWLANRAIFANSEPRRLAPGLGEKMVATARRA